MDSFSDFKITLPINCSKLLLHSCCAPCSCDIMRILKNSSIHFEVLFYNPNIDSKDEYNRRKKEVVKFASKLNVSFHDMDYEPSLWTNRIAGFENEPEKGIRCTKCFDLRMERSALFAHENNFDAFTSSIGISRYKDFAQLTACGKKAASQYEKLIYWDYNWRKNGGLERAEKISKLEDFYRQKYCGCIYSKR